VCGRDADELPAVDSDVNAIDRHRLPRTLEIALLGLFAERRADRPVGLEELVLVSRLPELDRRYPIFSSGA